MTQALALTSYTLTEGGVLKADFTAPVAVHDDEDLIYFPKSQTERAAFRSKDGKALSAFRWAVYDYACTIPVGKVVTYKDICSELKQGSPRSVGGALRNNPFAPTVPCHRVIASDLTLGGFYGEWTRSKQDTTGTQGQRKIKLLASEGVHFDKARRLKDRTCLWAARV